MKKGLESWLRQIRSTCAWFSGGVMCLVHIITQCEKENFSSSQHEVKGPPQLC